VRVLPDLEGAQPFWLFGLHRDVCDNGQPRASLNPVQQMLNVLGRSLENCLDPAVGEVAHPPGHTMVPRLPLAGTAEVDTLNPPGDQHPVADHIQTLRQGDAAIGHDVRMAESISTLVGRFYGELWNRWNDSAVEDTLSPGFTFRGSLGQQTSGRHGWRGYRDLVRSGSADFHNEIVELVCEGQRAAVRLRFTGTHTGVLLGMSATQRRFEYAGAAFFTADHQGLTSAWVLGDLDVLRRQLG
jgi:predicted ester cyclase